MRSLIIRKMRASLVFITATVLTVVACALTVEDDGADDCQNHRKAATVAKLERVIRKKLNALPDTVEKAKEDVLSLVERNYRLNTSQGYSILAASMADLYCEIYENNRTLEDPLGGGNGYFGHEHGNIVHYGIADGTAPWLGMAEPSDIEDDCALKVDKATHQAISRVQSLLEHCESAEVDVTEFEMMLKAKLACLLNYYSSVPSAFYLKHIVEEVAAALTFRRVLLVQQQQ